MASGLGYPKNTVSPIPSLWTTFHLKEVGLGAIHLEKSQGNPKDFNDETMQA